MVVNARERKSDMSDKCVDKRDGRRLALQTDETQTDERREVQAKQEKTRNREKKR